ncbi:MAG: hypothetical protein P1P84_15390 [Deferrisomatales bacterium]|nr:hypothetical protein [Deferrisomatales bacterium]
MEQRRRSMVVGVGQVGAAEVNGLAHGGAQTIADFAQTLGLSQLAERHGDEVVPGREACGVVIGLVFAGRTDELNPIDQS